MISFFRKLFGLDKELKTRLVNNPMLVDVRSPEEFNYEHIEGSVNVPLSTINTQLSKFKGKANIIVFCASGMRSSMAKKILLHNGITNVLNGGSWKKVQRLLKDR